MKHSTFIAALVPLLTISLVVTTSETSVRASQVPSSAAAGAAQGEAAEIQTINPNVDSSDYLRSIIGLRLAPVQLNIGNRNRITGWPGELSGQSGRLL